MLLRILKKDLYRKRTMNIILFMFIVLATMFLGSSTNNLVSISGATKSYVNSANIGNVIALTIKEDETKQVIEYAMEKEAISDCLTANMMAITMQNVQIVREGEAEPDVLRLATTSVVAQVPKDNFLVFDKEGEKIEVPEGYIAICPNSGKNHDIEKGDTLILTYGDYEKEFKVMEYVVDPIFDSDMVGLIRFYVNPSDYAKIAAASDMDEMCLFSLFTKESTEVMRDLKESGISFTLLEKASTFEMIYIMDMLVAGIMIIVSLCFIIIAFFILRFTISFTLQEDFKEIGVLKALGLRNSGIKRIYMIKYSFLAVTGGIIGFILSFPFGNFILEQALVNIKVELVKVYPVLNVISSVFVIGIVMLFSSIAAGKIKKYSAMQAVREGSLGESFSKISRLSLVKHKRMSAPVFMAFNDVLTNLKRYVILFFTFIMGTLLILLPLSASNTLLDESIGHYFGMGQSDFFINNGKLESYMYSGDKQEIYDDMEEISRYIEEELGYKNNVYVDVFYSLRLYKEDKRDAVNPNAMQFLGKESVEYKVTKGVAPAMDNEIMLSSVVAKELEVSVGDIIKTDIEGKEYELLVSGIMESLTNFGKTVRLSPMFDMQQNAIIGSTLFQVDIKENNADIEFICEKLIEKNPLFTIKNNREYIDSMLGSIIDAMEDVNFIMVFIVVTINILITVLTMKAFVAKDRARIAMLKSIGFSNKTIRIWQMLRIVLVLVSGIILGSLLSLVLDDFTIIPIFAVMGSANIDLVINLTDVVVKYPVILLVATTLAAYVCSAQIKHVDVKEVNNLE